MTERRTIDLTTVLGLVIAFGLILAAIMVGGSLGSFFNLPSVLIVVLGTMAVTAVSFAGSELKVTPTLVNNAVFRTISDPVVIGTQMIELSELARRNGPLALEQRLPELQGNRFLFKAIGLIVDGIPGDDIEQVLSSEISADFARNQRAISIIKRSAEVAPAMGLIGTLVGLVQMLANLEDPSTIGPAMAVALLTTFYGAVLGTMMLTPLAGKLERNANEENLTKRIYAVGAASIARQENPRRLEMLLNTILPPEKRINYFE
ncbi:MAG: MotA/TolQ/ExbB proton channel family protein [Alphaproteobacteria bacterium]|nr:MotA/TolQ/ExbB proton channel family protein [Alphaproteobacteria bacterium SS10]